MKEPSLVALLYTQTPTPSLAFSEPQRYKACGSGRLDEVFHSKYSLIPIIPPRGKKENEENLVITSMGIYPFTSELSYSLLLVFSQLSLNIGAIKVAIYFVLEFLPRNL